MDSVKNKFTIAGYDKDELIYLVKKCLEYSADPSDDNKWKAIQAVVLVNTVDMQNPVQMKLYVDNMSETRGDTVIDTGDIEKAEGILNKHISGIDDMDLTNAEKQIVMKIPIDPLVVFAKYTSLPHGPHGPHEPAAPPPGAGAAARAAARAAAKTYEGGGRKKSRRRTKRRKSKRRKSKKKKTRRRRR